MPTFLSRWSGAAGALMLFTACGNIDKAAVSKTPFASRLEALSKEPPNYVTLGQAVTGALEASDPQLPDTSYYDSWAYAGRRGDSIQITLESSSFDAFLIVYGPGGPEVGAVLEDDDGAGGTNARISALLPEDGEYEILVNSYGAGQTGAYTLRVDGQAATAASSRSGSAAPDWAARYRGGGDPNDQYALVVGIDDYEGIGTTLDGPVADANLIGSILVDRFGFQRRNVVTIANREATREHIAEAFLRHLGQAGPDGVAVFFYSGHGMRMANNVGLTGSLDPESTDNRDEALYIWGDDGKGSVLLDDELGFLADRLRTNRVLFIMDACFSGTGTRAIQRARAKEEKFEDVRSKMTLPAKYLTETATGAPGAGGELADLLGEPQRHLLLAASAENQLSWTADSLPKYTGKNSVFTYYLAEALEGASESATFGALMGQVTPATNSYTQRVYKRRQTPQIEGQQAAARVWDFLAKR